ncbi:flagellar motor protein [Geotalea uraniireducens]|uniref:Flagellar motor protein n=1 Tax=Geotalea uraniireducens TaxID=351604 RepID=A0ABM8EP77_9BACT|nr:flagellar motor protein [Geotalea uraniireducens]BDV44418.1 flagellar motor protein [Geotalea uraniireducens]
MDIATIIGWVLGFGAILGGAALEGLHMKAILQPTAAIIVLGGTFGAAFGSFPLPSILKAAKDAKKALFPSQQNPEGTIKDLIGYAAKARRNGLISLEQEAQNVKDPFTKKGISLVVDGIDPQKLRETLEIEVHHYEEHEKVSAEFFEAAGGYAPTIGIIGAVLGLIHVMQNLSDASKLGEGIAVAFVATIYGLVTANIVCLPLGTKLKQRLKTELLQKEMVIEGLIAIQNGENPHFIEQKLRAFVQESGKK